jgi:hypothetical protein
VQLAPSHDDISRAISELGAEISLFSYALFGLNSHDRPDLYASCLLLECDEIPVLVTASHAIDAIEKETRQGVHVSAKHLVALPGQFTRSSNSGDDLLDIAAIVLSEDFLQDQEMTALPLSRTTWRTPLSMPRVGCIHGYPCTKNKQRRQIDDATRTFRRHHRTYVGLLAERRDYQRFGKDPHLQIGLRYRKGRNEQGNQAVPPDPGGMSGGGIWVIPDFNAATATFLLGGIAIEHFKNNGEVVFGTHRSYRKVHSQPCFPKRIDGASKPAFSLAGRAGKPSLHARVGSRQWGQHRELWYTRAISIVIPRIR